jgi:hypothetical protein
VFGVVVPRGYDQLQGSYLELLACGCDDLSLFDRAIRRF